MEATVKVDEAVLADCGISITHFREAVVCALGKIMHPETGQPIHINGVLVTVEVSSPEVKKTTIVGPAALLPANEAMPANYSIEY